MMLCELLRYTSVWSTMTRTTNVLPHHSRQSRRVKRDPDIRLSKSRTRYAGTCDVEEGRNERTALAGRAAVATRAPSSHHVRVSDLPVQPSHLILTPTTANYHIPDLTSECNHPAFLIFSPQNSSVHCFCGAWNLTPSPIKPPPARDKTGYQGSVLSRNSGRISLTLRPSSGASST